ncbi:MAG: phosphoglycerate mutase, 2,3-bisphosphoglycerate-independent [Solirubrobacterales bacterium]|nr:phosphoglycerate mutase, 2,3-bisphosphoglycerate-independent [Solirubrobacterales bacterium]
MTLPAGAASLPAASACLIVLDGWGLAEPGPGNAVSLARTPIFDELWTAYPHTTLAASGRAVGLPDGQMGNSEVGHLNLGAGAVIRQDLVRIDDAIADGSLARNEVLRAALTAAGRVHLLGLVSDGGVHSSLQHLRALVELGEALAVEDLVVHAFTDGRDTLPHAGAGYLAAVDGMSAARVGSVIGRYWAMDRDRRWDRTQRAYDLLVHGRAPHHAASGEQAVADAYERGETDEFIEPTLVGDEARIRPGDSVIAFNFRPDRMRQLTRALAEPGFGDGGEDLPGWSGRGAGAPVARYATLTRYEEGWPHPVAFSPERPASTLSTVLAGAGASQLHVAETEKYAHVTYFFNGGEETPLSGERRELVASPRDVPTYDHKPEMSAHEAAGAFVRAWREDVGAGLRFGIINFANADMVGHTGVIEAAVKAVETVDESLGEVVVAVHAAGGVCVVTADHGNADHMLEPDGSPNTAHSLNPVPLILTSPGARLRDGGILADVAPTVLEAMGIEQPAQMTGRSLIDHG